MEKIKLSFQRDVTYGFSWPQRNFTCSFCKRVYKSAQALGGHMNVHRRDRAKLMRELSPSLHAFNNSNHNPNPSPSVSSPSRIGVNVNSDPNPIINPSFSSYGTSKHVPYYSYGMPLSPCLGSSFEEGKRYLKKKREDELRVFKKRKNFLKMDGGLKLNIGEDKQDLDLELRLGCS